MATGVKKGLTPARKVGSAPDNKGMTTYTIASGYSTNLGTQDPVKLSSGTLVLATNGANALGTLLGINYIDPTGKPQWLNYYPASLSIKSGTTIDAKVLDDPNATFRARCNGTVAQVLVGNIYAMDLAEGVDYFGNSQATVTVLAAKVGTASIANSTNLVSTLSITTGDAFSIKTSNAGSATTITIVTNETTATFLAALNAVPNISASLNASGFLVLQATDGYSLVLANTTNTPLTALGNTAGTYAPTVSAGSGMVKVIKVEDTVNNILEVLIVNESYRDNGAN